MTPARLDLGCAQFYWRVTDAPSTHPEIPAFLPFAFAFEPSLQLVIQQRNPEVLGWLDRVYREDANVGYLQEGHALANSYGGEFVGFLEGAISARASKTHRIAEIGCGGRGCQGRDCQRGSNPDVHLLLPSFAFVRPMLPAIAGARKRGAGFSAG